MKIGSLCSGYGGLEEGVRAAIGGEVAWQSEVDPGACKILAHRYPGVPNIGDMTAVDWANVEPIDVLVAGTPCQDLSLAGKRAGMTEGTRSNLWVSMREAIAQLRPGLVVWENVRGALSARASSDMELAEGRLGAGDDGPVLRALGRVLGDLADLGYDASWQGLRASDVGAPHGRFRVFVIAWPTGNPVDDDGNGRAGVGAPGGRQGFAASDADRLGHERSGRARQGRTGLTNGGLVLADADHQGRQGTQPAAGRHLPDGGTPADAQGDGRHERRPEPARLIRGSDAPLGGAPAAAHPDRYGLIGQSGPPARRHPVRADEWDDADGRGDGTAADGQGDAGRLVHGDDVPAVEWGPYAQAIRRWERVTRPAPAPTEMTAKGSSRLSPRFVEWLMGLPAGWVTDVPGLSRNEQLKALGNGVVPQQAAEALRLLLPDIEVAAA